MNPKVKEKFAYDSLEPESIREASNYTRPTIIQKNEWFDTENYRLSSFLSVLGKIMEKLIWHNLWRNWKLIKSSILFL